MDLATTLLAQPRSDLKELAPGGAVLRGWCDYLIGLNVRFDFAIQMVNITSKEAL